MIRRSGNIVINMYKLFTKEINIQLIYTMDINQRENARCMYIVKYRCLSAQAGPKGGGYPARAPLTVADL